MTQRSGAQTALRYSKFFGLALHKIIMSKKNLPAAIVTGGAKRIGAAIARVLHSNGFNICLHYRSSAGAADQLVNELNLQRENSAIAVNADLLDLQAIPHLVNACSNEFERIDLLINNASTFYPTPIELIEEEFWNDLVGSNLRAPAFLVKAAASQLRENNGAIINIVDIYARRPLSNHPIYCAAKAGLEMLTKALAQDLAPEIRVNAIAPGAILWPEAGNQEIQQSDLLNQIPLARMGEPEDIAKTVVFLAKNAPYITGQTIAVDGGRSIMP